MLVISCSGGWLRAEEKNLFDQAIEARGRGENQKALKILERCVEEGIEVHRAYFEMGKILLEQGKYRRAISVSEKAIKAYEEYLEAHPEDHRDVYKRQILHSRTSSKPDSAFESTRRTCLYCLCY